MERFSGLLEPEEGEPVPGHGTKILPPLHQVQGKEFRLGRPEELLPQEAVFPGQHLQDGTGSFRKDVFPFLFRRLLRGRRSLFRPAPRGGSLFLTGRFFPRCRLGLLF